MSNKADNILVAIFLGLVCILLLYSINFTISNIKYKKELIELEQQITELENKIVILEEELEVKKENIIDLTEEYEEQIKQRDKYISDIHDEMSINEKVVKYILEYTQMNDFEAFEEWLYRNHKDFYFKLIREGYLR